MYDFFCFSCRGKIINCRGNFAVDFANDIAVFRNTHLFGFYIKFDPWLIGLHFYSWLDCILLRNIPGSWDASVLIVIFVFICLALCTKLLS